MDCPACKEPLIVLELSEVEIDNCVSCGGIWLDHGELELLLEDSSQKDRFMSSFQLDRQSKEKARKCPICSKKMDKVLCGPDKDIGIDRCRNNDGIWVDRGELQQIIQISSPDEQNEVLDLLKDMFGRTMQ